jgi:DNA polymerase family A
MAHTQGPGGIGGFPPGIARTYVRMSQFVHRQVCGRAGRSAVASGPIDPGHTSQGRDMIGVVPVVELGLVLGGYAHTDEQHKWRCLLRNGAKSQDQFILVAPLGPIASVQCRDRFFNNYEGLQQWHRKTSRACPYGGSCETRTLAGRRRRGVTSVTEALNSPAQGSGADGLKLALGRLFRHRQEVPEARLVATVHDEIVMEAPAAEAEQTATWLRTHMIAAMLDLVGEQVPIEVEVTNGLSYAG